ncbi:MAG: acetyl-CoA synthetase, partial [Candidatus Aenigmarchaeota archaeon]|nr:acetyl-CoA synthetase [Candidatus Aenigmarchaeota archaeon]
FTEIYEDVTFRIAPIDRGDALQMISELKGAKLLEGVRGTPPADIEAVIHILLNVSKLMMDHDEVDQLDLNPVIVYPEGLCAVDSRIILKSKRDE